MAKQVQGVYANLTNNFAFIKTFASEQGKDLTIAMLNTCLERKLEHPIADIQIENPYIQGETKHNRDSVLDIKCKDSAGSQFIVEMQVYEQEFFIKRSLHYVSAAIVNHAPKGNWDFNFPKVYSLNFLSFDLKVWENCEEVLQYVSLQNEGHPEIHLDYINLVFVRLAKFKKELGECENFCEKFIYALRNSHKFKERPGQLSEDFFVKLLDVAKFTNFSVMEREEYMAVDKGIKDRFAYECLKEKREAAMREREAEFEERESSIEERESSIEKRESSIGERESEFGKQKSDFEERLTQTAKAMKAKGMNSSLIAEVTGLPVAKIKKM